MRNVRKHKKIKAGFSGYGIGGFSLIEVTISIAITAVALVSLMGMLPAGMRIMREAGDRAVETRIHQEILSEILLVKWEARFEFDHSKAGLRFYDDQGILLNKSAMTAEEFDFSRVYTARVNVPKVNDPLPNSLGGTVYKGVITPGETAENPNLQLAIVEITSVLEVDQPSEFDDPNFEKTIRTFQATITEMGKNLGK